MSAAPASAGLDGEMRKTIDVLLDHCRRSDGYAYDPYDSRVGNMYTYLNKVAKTPLGKIYRNLVYGIEMMAPVTYRKVRGIKKTWDPMGNSYIAGTLMTLHQLDNDHAKLEEAKKVLDRIVTKAVGEPGIRGFALGFPCITGSNLLWSTEVPVAHYTLRTARKFMIWERQVGDGRYNAILDENMRFLTEGLAWVEVDGLAGVGYTPADPMQVINIWMDVASTLACYGTLRGDHRYKDKAIALTESTIAHLLPDDTWSYEAKWIKKKVFVDNNHTGMVIGALADVALCYPEMREKIREVLERAVTKWLDMFFDEGTGRFWNVLDRKHVTSVVALPDAHYAIFRLLRPEVGLSKELCQRLVGIREKITRWSLDNMRMFDGRFCVFRYPFKRYSVGGVRSFDALIADAFAITYVAPRLEGDPSKLWTI